MQAKAGELVPEMRVRGCLRWPYEQAIRVLTGAGNACYRGLQTCGSVWACAVCASRVSEERRKELTAAIAAAVGLGLAPYLVTFTVRHKWADGIRATCDGLLAARKRLRSGKGGEQFRERWGLVGTVRALEVTHGKNGWHPHVHELVFVREGGVAPQLEADLRERWSGAVSAVGLRDVNDHGVRVQAADEAISSYVAKFGTGRAWGAEEELSKAVSKSGRPGHRTPVDLLAAATFDGDEAAGRLWQEYARGFFGRRQLAWSKGLRDLLGLSQERTDAEIAADVGEKCRVLAAVLSLRQWRAVVGNDARGELLQVAARGGAAAVWNFLRGIGAGSTVEDIVSVRELLEGGLL